MSLWPISTTLVIPSHIDRLFYQEMIQNAAVDGEVEEIRKRMVDKQSEEIDNDTILCLLENHQFQCFL